MKKKWIIFGVVAAVLLGVGIYVGVITLRYTNFDDYKQYLQTETVEQATAFTPIAEENPSVASMVLVAQNEKFKLYTNTKTTEIALYIKASDQVLYSNPQDRDTEVLGSQVNKDELNATVSLEYYTQAGQRVSINNYNLSIAHEQYTAEKIKDGIRYTYTIEDPENALGLIPEIISEERLNTLVLDRLEKGEKRQITGIYKLDGGYYRIQSSATKNKIGMKRVAALFEKAGYTEEDYAVDMEGVISDTVSFTLSVDYRLTDKGLQASVPTSSIRERGGAKLYRLELLKYFGAGTTQEQGSLFVPSGSGALIHFNNGKEQESAYVQYVYGMDPVSQGYVNIENKEEARLPVFGILNQSKDVGVLAVVEQGDALASINADVAGRLNSYNYVYSKFSLREMEVLELFGASGTQASVPTVEKELYKTCLTVHYCVTGATYSDLANTYREKLVAEGVLRTPLDDSTPALWLDILGGAEKTKHFLGVPYDGLVAATTFEQAMEIAGTLQENGVKSIQMNYLGWFNGGVYHDAPNRINILSQLGGQQGIESLSKELEESSSRLSVEVGFQKAASNAGGYNFMQESSRYNSGYVVALGAVDPTNLMMLSDLEHEEWMQYYISPKFLCRYMDGFLHQAQSELGGAGLNLSDLANTLTSDKKRAETIDRQMALQIVQGNLEKLETMPFVSASDANGYAFGYVDAVTDVPTSCAGFRILDESIPFYQMVIHGYIAYYGSNWNDNVPLSNTSRLLRYVEYGMLPKYELAYSTADALKYSALENHGAIYYVDWIEDIAQTYSYLQQALAPVQDAQMIEHTCLQEGLYRITYSNSIAIYVNYNDQAVQVDNITVEAQSYTVKGGAHGG